MDCAYVARQRVLVANRPEDLAHYPAVTSSCDDPQRSESPLGLTATLTTNSVVASCLLRIDESLSPGSSASSSASSSKSCRCIIDMSSAESLRRDFYNWLQGNEPTMSPDRPCVFDESTAFIDSTPTTSSINTTQQYSTADRSNTATAYVFNQQPLMPMKRPRQKRIKTESVVESDGPTGLNTSTEKPKKRRGGSNRGTNLYGRAYCPGRPLSMDERYQIICLFQAGMKVNAISKQLCISHGCVSKIITRFRETGLLIPSSHAECRRRKRMLMEAAAVAAYQQQSMSNG